MVVSAHLQPDLSVHCDDQDDDKDLKSTTKLTVVADAMKQSTSNSIMAQTPLPNEDNNTEPDAKPKIEASELRQSEASSLLLSLPRELRDKIYRNILVAPDRISEITAEAATGSRGLMESGIPYTVPQFHSSPNPVSGMDTPKTSTPDSSTPAYCARTNKSTAKRLRSYTNKTLSNSIVISPSARKPWLVFRECGSATMIWTTKMIREALSPL